MTAPASAYMDVEQERFDLVPAHRDPVEEATAMADAHLAREEEVRRVGAVVRWLDDAVRVPGTKFGIGLDAALGFLLPGVGDAITGAVAFTVVFAAIRRGVPKVVVARMLMNIGVDTLVGLVPVAGDLFDLLWRSNTRNLALLERHHGELEPKARASDYVWVGAAATLVAATVAAPFAAAWWLFSAIFG